MKTTETLESIIKIPEIAERIANHLLFADFSRLHCVSKKIFGCLYDTRRWEEEGKQRFGTLMPEPKIVRARAAYLYLKTEYSPKGRSFDNVVLDFSKGTLNLVPLHAKRRSGPQPIRSRLPLAPSFDQLAKQFYDDPTPSLARALNILVQRPPSKEDLRRKIEQQGGTIKITLPGGKIWQAKPHTMVREKTACLQLLAPEGEVIARLLRTKNLEWASIYIGNTDFPLAFYLKNSKALTHLHRIEGSIIFCSYFGGGAYVADVARDGWSLKERIKTFVVDRPSTLVEKLHGYAYALRSAFSRRH